MLFSTGFIALCTSAFLHGVAAAPNGIVSASGMMPAVSPVPAVTNALAAPIVVCLPTTTTAVKPAPKPTKGVAPNDIIIVIRTVTTVSNDLNIALTKVTTSVTLVDLTKISGTAVQGFTKIVTDIGNAVALLPGSPLISGDIADDVVEVLVAFVKVHQALLSTVIGKHSIFAQFALTAPLDAVLRLIEAGVDSFAFGLIGLIPTKKNIIQKQIAGLDVTVKSSISVYSQICFPSPGFPAVMPSCVKI